MNARDTYLDTAYAAAYAAFDIECDNAIDDDAYDAAYAAFDKTLDAIYANADAIYAAYADAYADQH